MLRAPFCVGRSAVPARRGRGSRLARLAGLGLILLCGCQRAAGSDDPPAVVATPIAPAAVAGEDLGALRFEAGFVLSSADPRFGGLSGLWLDPEGTGLIAASDRGTLWHATLTQDADGRLIGLSGWRTSEPGEVAGDPDGRDAESLARAPGGGVVIAYEGGHRLRRVMPGDPAAAVTPLPVPEALGRPHNRGIEALTALPDGRLLALAEGVPAVGPAAGPDDLQGWLIAAGEVEALSYRTEGGFVPTGAARLDDRIYVLERRFALLGGFAARVVILPVEAIHPGARLVPQVVGALTTKAINENFEGIAVRRGPDGRPQIYVVSDDNFSPLQQTMVLQLRHDPSR